MIYEFNMENMNKYLENYDVLYHKYFWDLHGDEENLLKQAVRLEKRGVIDRSWDIEKAQNAYITVSKIYADDMKECLGIVQLARDKFLGYFVGIPGIQSLFHASYFYFEWMMHLEYKKAERDYSHYRDYYIHQIKNMYEMLVFLDECGFMERCIAIYKEESSIIAEDIRNSVRMQFHMVTMEEKELFKNIVEVGREGIIQKETDKSKNTGIQSNAFDEDVEKRMEDNFYRYIMHAASIIAALVHDIGYPIDYMLRTTKTLHEFLPLSASFIHINDAMPHLENILQESLLYRTVSPDKIAKRVRDEQNHGAISAVILLSKYYDTGAIYQLKPIERMAIELAAVVIYNHTVHYGCMTGKEEEYYRNFFDENPLSYLFRLCDDMQEWGRIYFDISKKSNFMICPKCGMPITKLNPYEKKSLYTCACGTVIDKKTQFMYRKLMHIDACKSIEVEQNNSVDVNVKDKVNAWTIQIKYDMEALLQMSYYNPDFALHRAEGIYEIKQMLERQREFPLTYVDTFLTCNPIAIKVKCLENGLYSWLGKNNYANCKIALNDPDFYNESVRNLFSAMKCKNSVWIGEEDTNDKNSINITFGEVWRICIMTYQNRNNVCVKVRHKWKQNLYFYLVLSFIGNIMAKKKKGLDETDKTEDAVKTAQKISIAFGIVDRPTQVLIMEYLLLKWNYISKDEFEQDNTLKEHSSYCQMWLSNQFIADMVREYTGSNDYDTVKKVLKSAKNKKDVLDDLKGIYDFYTDYDFFLSITMNC